VIASVSIVLLWGALIWFLIRYTSLRLWPALACVLFGLFVGSTLLAPYIRSVFVALARLTGIEL
jgi:hypothetical protein